MTTARQRMLYGKTTNNMPSRFLKEVPEENSEWLSRADNQFRRSEWEDTGFGSPFASTGFYQRPSVEYRGTKSSAASSGFTTEKKAAAAISLQKGDSIHHKTFGDGMVLSVRPMGGDALIEVAFNDVGTKKLMLKTAGAHITKL